jgi:hypothetical protein
MAEERTGTLFYYSFLKTFRVVSIPGLTKYTI